MSTTKAKINKNGVTELPLEARAIHCITDFPAPATVQDTVDQHAAEFLTASLLRTQAEKRYEAIKRLVIDEHPTHVAMVRNSAVEMMQKSTTNLVGVDWQLDFAANKPAVRTDIDELRTELVRQGVKVDVIDAAINKVSKKSMPALVISAKPVV